MSENKIKLLNEEIWAVHKYLDEVNIPRENSNGRVYSIVGRIKQLELFYIKKMSEMETSTMRQTLN